jgi:hypothetical protein
MLELYILFEITCPTDECERPLLKLLVFLSMSTPDFGIADVVVPPNLFFSFRYKSNNTYSHNQLATSIPRKPSVLEEAQERFQRGSKISYSNDISKQFRTYSITARSVWKSG